MQITWRSRLAACAAAPVILLTACGGNSTGSSVNASGTPGSLIQNPPARVLSLTAADLTAELNATSNGQSLLALATGHATGGSCKYGVDVYYLQYATVGGAGEATTASGALIVPTGGTGGPATSLGPAPIVLYAHGTETLKAFNMANFLTPVDDTADLVAAVFASNGYTLVAPNYAGYDTSELSYHPYLNALQQSTEMINALTAARAALSSGALFASAPTDNGQLFITGYSEGGHVAMATQRAMEAAGMTVTASAPCSGPYALAAFGDSILYGDVDFGATGFAPLITSCFYNSYKSNPAIGNIYNGTTGTSVDAYAPAWAAGIDALFPGPVSADTLILGGEFPLALFNSTPPSASDINTGVVVDDRLTGTTATTVTEELTALLPGISPPSGNPLFASGFASTYLWLNAYRVGGLADALLNPDGVVPTLTTGMPSATAAHPLRKAFILNDMRTPLAPATTLWQPKAPLLMVGGHNDPEVFYPVNTGTMSSIWGAVPGLHTVQTPLDVDPGISFTALGQVAAGAFLTDVQGEITSPDQFAADMNTALAAALAPANYTITNASQPVFLQVTALALASQLTGTAISGLISQVTQTGAPFTTAVLGANAAAIATAIGTTTATVLTEAYHADIVEPVATAATLQFFQQF